MLLSFHRQNILRGSSLPAAGIGAGGIKAGLVVPGDDSDGAVASHGQRKHTHQQQHHHNKQQQEEDEGYHSGREEHVQHSPGSPSLLHLPTEHGNAAEDALVQEQQGQRQGSRLTALVRRISSRRRQGQQGATDGSLDAYMSSLQAPAPPRAKLVKVCSDMLHLQLRHELDLESSLT